MRHETDDQIAVAIIEEVQRRFSDFRECSFDKAFRSPRNQVQPTGMFDRSVLPRKGQLSAINKETENSEAFKAARRRHSAVESAINAPENHGLDRCPNRGIDGFKRYKALSV